MNLEFKKDILFRELKQDILSGVFPPGYRFPPELEFAKRKGVSFQTLRSALGMLCASGLIARIPGKGTFVLDPASRTQPEKKSGSKTIGDPRSASGGQNVADAAVRCRVL